MKAQSQVTELIKEHSELDKPGQESNQGHEERTPRQNEIRQELVQIVKARAASTGR